MLLGSWFGIKVQFLTSKKCFVHSFDNCWYKGKNKPERQKAKSKSQKAKSRSKIQSAPERGWAPTEEKNKRIGGCSEQLSVFGDMLRNSNTNTGANSNVAAAPRVFSVGVSDNKKQDRKARTLEQRRDARKGVLLGTKTSKARRHGQQKGDSQFEELESSPREYGLWRERHRFFIAKCLKSSFLTTPNSEKVHFV